jgi:phosphate transport system substrate-binding protein
MFAKSAKLALILGAAALVLTACTPPMPPEVKAALLEQTYTCVDGNVNVASGEALTDAVSSIQGAMQGACPSMAIAPLEAASATAADTGIYISAVAPSAAQCVPANTVPYALDAGLVVASLANAAGVQLSPATVAGIFDGSITKWDDAKITADNAGAALDSEPISVIPVTDKNAKAAFAAWYQHLTGKTFAPKLLTTVKTDETVADLGDMTEGSIALMPFSTFSLYSVNAATIPLAANILVGGKDASGSPAIATPDVTGIVSAGTQLAVSKTGTDVSVKMNFAAKAMPAAGSDVAVTPYGAIYPVNMVLCATGGTGKTANKVTHAVARYMLRQDSQGSLTALTGLPDLVRASALDGVAAGLPDPKIPAATN